MWRTAPGKRTNVKAVNSGRSGVQSAMSQPQVLSELVQLSVRFGPQDAQLGEQVLVLLRGVPLVL